MNEDGPVDRKILDSFCTAGIQAQNSSEAIARVDELLAWSFKSLKTLKDEPVAKEEEEEYADGKSPEMMKDLLLDVHEQHGHCRHSRDIRYFAQHKLVDILRTSAGGI